MNIAIKTGSRIAIAMLATLLAVSSTPLLAAKGGGGKVTVTEANPPEATQGDELDVIVSGTGFDDGSTATWFVTGTNDDSQIQVLSNEYLPSTGQLKARIKVNGNANVNDYDIQVRNSRGRRGKGTTLFRVKLDTTNKVSVTFAQPANAYQGEELDVLISGDGFDEGSTARWTVVGTNDDSHVQVLSNQYLPATGQLSSRIKINNNAIVDDYDIEVRNSGGHRGTGNLLFKVRSAELPNYAFLVKSPSPGGGEMGLMDVEGGSFTRVIKNEIKKSVSSAWLAEGDAIVWKDNLADQIKLTTPDGVDLAVLVQETDDLRLDSRPDSIDSVVDSCGTGSSIVYLSVRDNSTTFPSGSSDLSSVNPFDPGSYQQLTFTTGVRTDSIAVSRDGSLVARWQRDSEDALNVWLEIRDLCEPGLPILWAWTATELGLQDGDQALFMDWSVDGILAISTRNWFNSEGEGGIDDENIWLIDLFPPGGSSSVLASRLTGAGGLIHDDSKLTSASPTWSPDGKFLAFHTTLRRGKRRLEADKWIYVYDLETGELSEISEVWVSAIDWRNNWTPQP